MTVGGVYLQRSARSATQFGGPKNCWRKLTGVGRYQSKPTTSEKSTILDFGKRCFCLLCRHFAKRSLRRDQQPYKNCRRDGFRQLLMNSEVFQEPMRDARDRDSRLR